VALEKGKPPTRGSLYKEALYGLVVSPVVGVGKLLVAQTKAGSKASSYLAGKVGLPQGDTSVIDRYTPKSLKYQGAVL